MSRAPRTRWTNQLTDEGAHPDPRFSFANERTFLAWIRTSLALVAAGIGVDAFATDLPEWGRHALSALLVVMGGLLAASAFRRWLRAEVALRHGEPLPTNRLAPIIAYGLTIGAVLALVLVFLER
jgi:putative membrane protein